MRYYLCHGCARVLSPAYVRHDSGGGWCKFCGSGLMTFEDEYDIAAARDTIARIVREIAAVEGHRKGGA